MATFFEKLGAYSVVARTILVILARFLTAPLRPKPGTIGLYRDAMYAGHRYYFSKISLSQEMYLCPSTEAQYLDLARKKSFQPDTVKLASGCKAHWIGNRDAQKILVYFHGGGFVMPCTHGHVQVLHEITKDLSKSCSISSILVQYTSATEGPYPLQLGQAAELLDYLIKTERRRPSDIIIAGESAGAHLTFSLISHILHPHPDVPTKIKIEEPLRAAIVISPWIDFDLSYGSFDRNAQSDVVGKEVLTRWSGAYLGGATLDSYNQPVAALPGWFDNVDTAIEDLLIWGGGKEVLVDSIYKIAEQMKEVLPGTKVVIEPDACHIKFIIEKLKGSKEKPQSTELIEAWILSLFQNGGFSTYTTRRND